MRIIFAAFKCGAAALICGVLLISCARAEKGDGEQAAVPLGMQPMAVLKAGEYPLWFQLGQQGPELINSIDEACYSRALIPWPLAPHIRFMLARSDAVFLAVNTDGFLVFSPWEAGEGSIALYRFSGGDWQPYTVGAFVFYDDTPTALLYRDDRFLDTGAPLPSPRTWTFSMETAEPFAFNVPALEFFPASDGWDIDALRFCADGFWYYRAVKKDKGGNEIRFLRGRSLDMQGETIGSGSFHNSALPETPAAAPPALQALLAAMDTGTVMAVSPDFGSQRYFANTADSQVNVLGFCRRAPPAALAIELNGRGLFAVGEAAVPAPLALPALPENFVYTGITLCGQTIVAVWEEQEEYNTGAAGFMVLRLPTGDR